MTFVFHKVVCSDILKVIETRVSNPVFTEIEKLFGFGFGSHVIAFTANRRGEGVTSSDIINRTTPHAQPPQQAHL